jgi:predicted SAM-dependent methyltransferase
MKKLNVGCGKDIRKGWVNLDSKKLAGVDVAHDINKAPWPFKANEFDEILCQDVLEHAEDIISTMKEIHRVLKPNGIARIRVPHFTSANAYNDPTHTHFFAWNSFDYFQKSSQYHFYVNFSFEIAKRRLEFGKKWALWNWIIQPIANLLPRFYEDTPFRIFPAMNLHFVLRKRI